MSGMLVINRIHFLGTRESKHFGSITDRPPNGRREAKERPGGLFS